MLLNFSDAKSLSNITQPYPLHIKLYPLLPAPTPPPPPPKKLDPPSKKAKHSLRRGRLLLEMYYILARLSNSSVNYFI